MQIFPNGTLSYVQQSVQSLTSDGMPIPAQPQPTISAPCTITTLTDNLHGRTDDGPYRNLQMTITANYDDLPEDFRPTHITITHNRYGKLGTHQVQRIQHHDITQTIEIWL